MTSVMKRQGTSQKNDFELKVAANLLKFYHRETPDKSIYMLSPYNGQVNAMKKLRDSDDGLHWWNRDHAYSIGSSQGREADLVLISLVNDGTKKGFLNNVQRANVAITRCKKGLIVITDPAYIEAAKDTLFGKLYRYLSHAKHASARTSSAEPPLWMDRVMLQQGDLAMSEYLPVAYTKNWGKGSMVNTGNLGDVLIDFGQEEQQVWDMDSLIDL